MNNEDKINIPVISKENGFTAIRIICALIVLYEHMVVLTGLPLLFLELRGTAVDVFFILSGFWVTRSYFTSDNILHFYKKRIKKIFPPYLIVVFSSAILLAFISSISIRDYYTNGGFWKYLAANVITLNFLHPDLPGVFNGEAVNGSLWTIKIELGFYIILPLILFLCFHNSRIEKKNTRCFVVLFIFYFLSVLYSIFIPRVIDYYHLPSSIQHQLPAFITFFCVGMLSYFFYDKIFPLLNKLVIPSFLILVLSIILDNFYMSIILEPIVLGITVMWLALKCRPLFVLSKVYDFSYWLYLVHYPIIMVIKNLC